MRFGLSSTSKQNTMSLQTDFLQNSLQGEDIQKILFLACNVLLFFLISPHNVSVYAKCCKCKHVSSVDCQYSFKRLYYF